MVVSHSSTRRPPGLPYRHACCLIVKSMKACYYIFMSFWKSSFTASILSAADSTRPLHISSSSSRRALNLSRSNLFGMQFSYAFRGDLRILLSWDMLCCCVSFSWKASKSFLSFSASAMISCLKTLHSSYWAVAMTLCSNWRPLSSYVMNCLCCSLILVMCWEMIVASYDGSACYIFDF